MCVILDASKFSDFVNVDKEDMEPVRQWIENGGRLAYSPTPKIERELNNYRAMREKIFAYRQAGKLKLVDKAKVMKKQAALTGLKSNDPHIIALALVANVKLLISGDNKLNKDFQNKIKGGRIYKGRQHKKLFRGLCCP